MLYQIFPFKRVYVFDESKEALAFAKMFGGTVSRIGVTGFHFFYYVSL